jgi:tRNA-Thr(GGU) m(6)t(6)A37 methyltransferase TsaA
MFEVDPIGTVRAERTSAEDDYWGGSTAIIELSPHVDGDALVGLEAFSHAEIVYLFHLVRPDEVVLGARHPRNNPDWPRVGIFAQRAKKRPNRIGTTLVRVVERAGRTLRVAELDAVDGTPVLDIKPVLREFLPREPIAQPAWATELMERYWLPAR